MHAEMHRAAAVSSLEHLILCLSVCLYPETPSTIHGLCILRGLFLEGVVLRAPCTIVVRGDCFHVQGSEGERDPNAGPKVYRHTVVPPLPGVDRNSEGTLDLPDEILTWKGSIFSIFSNVVADWQGSGYGPLLQTPSVRRLCILNRSLRCIQCTRMAKEDGAVSNQGGRLKLGSMRVEWHRLHIIIPSLAHCSHAKRPYCCMEKHGLCECFQLTFPPLLSSGFICMCCKTAHQGSCMREQWAGALLGS